MRPRFRLAAVATIAALASVGGLLAAVPAGATGHDISTNSIADPGFSKFGATYHVQGTGGRVPMYKSTALSTRFSFVGNAFTAARLSGYTNVWAPHVTQRNGKYFLFFAADRPGAEHCIYWAVSSTNAAESYSAPKLLLCAANRPGESWEAIDPSTFETAANNTYLVWRSGHIQPADFPVGDYKIQAVMLRFSGSTVSLAPGAARVTMLSVENKAVMEAPDLIRYNNKVYLFISRGDYRNSSYHTDVYIAPTIHDQFRLLRTVMATGQGFGSGPGGAEVAGIGNNQTGIAWHFRDGAGQRHARVGVIEWRRVGASVDYAPYVV
ncbi:family 43 glycosylhydrolase [Kribbella sp. NPDC056861]|uniref:family 43 glycosylhydrolase n=1 Tax=Kribbella sp. NPDC056861 TaxID=3154857 RepID=UPI00341F9244